MRKEEPSVQVRVHAKLLPEGKKKIKRRGRIGLVNVTDERRGKSNRIYLTGKGGSKVSVWKAAFTYICLEIEC